MHRLYSLILCLGLMLPAANAIADDNAAKVKALNTTDPSRVLFVGNSYMFYGDGLHSHVRRMVKDAGFHDGSLKYKLATISGARLSDHCLSCYIDKDRLRVGGPFQVVILQDQSGTALYETRQKEFRETVISYAKAIRMAQGEPALYMPPAYVAPHKSASPELVDLNSNLYTRVGNEVGALVIPVGLAFAEAYRQRPDIKLHQDFDGSHPTLLGTYLAAATVFAAIYDASPVGNSYDYFGKINKDDAKFLQMIADTTVKTYLGR